jgi:hypothetical protein
MQGSTHVESLARRSRWGGDSAQSCASPSPGRPDRCPQRIAEERSWGCASALLSGDVSSEPDTAGIGGDELSQVRLTGCTAGGDCGQLRRAGQLHTGPLAQLPVLRQPALGQTRSPTSLSVAEADVHAVDQLPGPTLHSAVTRARPAASAGCLSASPSHRCQTVSSHLRELDTGGEGRLAMVDEVGMPDRAGA